MKRSIELSRVSPDRFKALESKISLKKLREYVDRTIMDMHQFEVSWISVVEPSKLFKDECLEENIQEKHDKIQIPSVM